MKRHRTTSKERMTEFCRDVTSHGEQGAHDGIPSRSDIARSAKQS